MVFIDEVAETNSLIAGVTYDSPLQYKIISRTGAVVREGFELGSSQICKLNEGDIISVSERKYLQSHKIVRLQLKEPVNGFITESKTIVALLTDDIPSFCQAMTNLELAELNKKSFNSKGESWRDILDRKCKLDIALIHDGYDVDLLSADLSIVDSYFIAKDSVPGKTSSSLYENTKGWLSIPLRSINGDDGELGNRHTGEVGTYKSTQIMGKCKYIPVIVNELLSKGLDVQKVRLMKLMSGGVIAPHRDFFSEDNVVRLHIAIITHSSIMFTVRDRDYHLAPGKLFFTNVRQTHSLENSSSIDRVHLVIDIVVNDEFTEKLKVATGQLDVLVA